MTERGDFGHLELKMDRRDGPQDNQKSWRNVVVALSPSPVTKLTRKLGTVSALIGVLFLGYWSTSGNQKSTSHPRETSPQGVPSHQRKPASGAPDPGGTGNCAKADVLAAHPQVADFFKTPRDQDSVGWCYAFPTADLLTLRLGVPVSAVDVAILLNHHAHSDIFMWLFSKDNLSLGKGAWSFGGEPKDGIRVARKYGLCTEKDMPSNSNLRADEAHALITAMRGLERLRKKIRDENLSIAQFMSDPGCAGSLQRFLPGIDLTTLYNVIKTSSNEHINNSLFRLEQKNCAGKRIALPQDISPARMRSWNSTRNQRMSKLDDLLSKGEAVIASVESDTIDGSGRRGEHTAIVLGREMRGGKCKYLIRNSWGTGCSFYLPSIQADCDPIRGSFWISEEQLRRGITQIDYLN